MNTNERLPLQQRVNLRLRDALAQTLGSAIIAETEARVISEELRDDLGLASQQLGKLEQEVAELREAVEDQRQNEDPDEPDLFTTPAYRGSVDPDMPVGGVDPLAEVNGRLA